MASVTQTPTANKVQRAAIYPRVSSRGQEQDGTSLGTQEQRCRQYAKEHDYTVDDAHVYREVHTGTELWERPQLTKLREAIRTRAVDVVIVYAIDRLSRDPVHLGVLISEADHVGVPIVFVSEPLDDSPEGQLIRFVRGYAAKIEHEKIKERMMRGRLARAEAGKYIPGNRVRYGYRWRDEGKTALDIDDTTARVVRRMFTEALAGKTLRQIGAHLTADGIPTPTNTGNGWRHSSIRQILNDKMYSGYGAAFRRVYTVREDGRTVRDSRSGDGKVLLPADVVPAIVNQDVADAVQERLRRNQEQASRNLHDPESTLLRAGFVVCGYCGQTMTVHHADKAAYSVTRYRCRNRDDGYWRCEGRGVTIAARKLDAIVWQRVEATLLRPETIAQQIERLLQTDDTTVDLATIDRRIAEIERRQRNLAGNLALVNGDAARLVAEQLTELGSHREALDNERKAILTRRDAWEQTKGRLDALEIWCHTVAANLKEFSYQDKRDLLDTFGIKVKVWRQSDPQRYEITSDIAIEPSIVDSRTIAGVGPRSDCAANHRLPTTIAAAGSRMRLGPRLSAISRLIWRSVARPGWIPM